MMRSETPPAGGCDAFACESAMPALLPVVLVVVVENPCFTDERRGARAAAESERRRNGLGVDGSSRAAEETKQGGGLGYGM